MKELTSITTTESVELFIIEIGAIIAGVGSIFALTVLIMAFMG